MALDEFNSLLGDLADAFGEPVQWQGRTFVGRFRIDPFVVPLPGMASGIGTTETWLYCERAVVLGGAPDIGGVLTIRGRHWEIVEVGEDDLGELAFRLIKHEGGSVAATGDDDEQHRAPGRPTRREEIERAYETLAGQIDPAAPLSRVVFPAIRRAITGSPAPAPGLTDKTLGKALRPLVAARRKPA